MPSAREREEYTTMRKARPRTNDASKRVSSRLPNKHPPQGIIQASSAWLCHCGCRRHHVQYTSDKTEEYTAMRTSVATCVKEGILAILR